MHVFAGRERGFQTYCMYAGLYFQQRIKTIMQQSRTVETECDGAHVHRKGNKLIIMYLLSAR